MKKIILFVIALLVCFNANPISNAIINKKFPDVHRPDLPYVITKNNNKNNVGSWGSYSWIKIFFKDIEKPDGTPKKIHPYCFKTNNLYVEFRDGGEEMRTYWDSTADNGKGGRGAHVTAPCYKIWDHSRTGVQYYKCKSDYKAIEAETSHYIRSETGDNMADVVVDSSYGIDGNCIIWLKKTNIDHIEVHN